MKRLTASLGIGLLLILVSGCTTARSSRSTGELGDVVAAAGGAAVGHVLSDGNAAATLGGAAAGFAVKRYADNVRDKEEKNKIQEAYDSAHAEATRELYDATQRLQSISTAPTSSEAAEPIYLPTQLPERSVNGVIIEPSVEYIRISDNSAK